jgi:predicted alpha/beta hydrolase family esterase
MSGLIVLGALGHVNASSGLGDWPQGRALLDAFSAGLSR